MQANIISIGNSRGLIIPKSLISKLNSDKVEIEATEEGLFIKPIHKIREGWETSAKQANTNGDDKILLDFNNDFDEEEWTW